MESIKTERASVLKPKPEMEGIVFGTQFTDYMFVMNYDEGQGWHDPRIVPFADFSLSPAALVFHYAQEIFEGMKAYRGPKGEIRLFRPMENITRMNRSAKRMCIPEIPEDVFLEALMQLVELEKDWVPHEPESSLYIRPFCIATDPRLGVHSGHSYIFSIICCPVGSYYPEGIDPVRIMIESKDVRTVRGGTGIAKCGGNYAASLRAGENAEREGFSQVLWLDGVERRNIEEVGSMNVMFKIGDTIVTPELSGSVLPGITRKSCLELLKSWGYTVEERTLPVDELIAAAADGSLMEAWGTGTAAVITPIGEIFYNGKGYEVGGFKIGEVTQRLYDMLTGIQWGKIDDPYGWTQVVCQG